MNTDDSEVESLREFVSKVMSLQKLLHTRYHDEKCVRDRAMTEVSIHSIQISVRDCILRTAQQLATRIAHLVYDRAKTAHTTPI